MIDQILNKLPILNDFDELKRGISVYSKQYGVGKIHSVYKGDEVIVQFSKLRKRLSVHDGISQIPEKYLQKQVNTKVEVVCDGKIMSFVEFKKKNKAAKKRMKLEEQLQKEEQKRALALKRRSPKARV